MKKLVITIFILLTIIYCGKTQEKLTIRIAISSPLDETDVYYWTASQFKNSVENKSNGRISVKIYDSMKLGSEQEVVQDVINNKIEMCMVAVNNVTPFSPSIGFFDLPYFFENKEEFYKVRNTLLPEINRRISKESGLRIILLVEQGYRFLTNSKKPVYRISDLYGLKIRTPKNIIQKMTFEEWGADVKTIKWSETTDSLIKRFVDGQENPITIINSMKFYYIQTYITQIHYKLWIGPIITNQNWFKSLSESDKNTIISSAEEVGKLQKEYVIELEKKAHQNLIKNGMIDCGIPEDEEIWKRKARALWPKYYTSIGGLDLARKAAEIIGKKLPE